jgi:ABC-type lipoprotein release transport system permease subunit
MRSWILVRLALRNVSREARRAVLTCSAMALGLALLVFSRALADGGHEDWIDAGVRMGQGHIVVQAPGHLESGSIDDRLSAEQVDAIMRAIVDVPRKDGPPSTTTRLSVTGLASSATSALPVRIEGVNPETETEFSFFPGKLVEGRYLEADDRLAAFVGTGLVERLGLRLGSRFVVTAQATNGEIEGQLVRVVGIFRTGLDEADEGMVHIPIGTARSWLGAGGATSVGMLLEHSLEVEEILGGLQDRLQDPGIRVMSWSEASPELYAAVKVDDYGDYIFHAILFGIIALAVLNSVLMSVLYRKREFGVLQALGLSARQTGAVVFLEGVLLTAFAGVVGVIFGLAITWGFFADGLDFSFALEGEFDFAGIVLDPVIVPEFRWVQLVQSAWSIGLVGVLASIYPAVHAMHLDVAESMKFER